MRNDIGYITGFESPVDEFLGLGKKDKAYKLQKRAQRQKTRLDKEAVDNGLIPLDPVTGKPLYAKAGSVDGSGNIKTDDQLNPAPVQPSAPNTLSQLPTGVPLVDNSTSAPMPQFQPGVYNGGAYDAASMMPLTDDLNQTDMNTPQPSNGTMENVTVSAPAKKNQIIYIVLAIAAVAAFYFMSKQKAS